MEQANKMSQANLKEIRNFVDGRKLDLSYDTVAEDENGAITCLRRGAPVLMMSRKDFDDFTTYQEKEHAEDCRCDECKEKFTAEYKKIS